MTSDLMRWEMRNPLEVLLSREAAALKGTCAGCRHTKEVVDPFGGIVIRCLKGRPHGNKCAKYEVNR